MIRDSDHIMLSQGHYIERMLKRFDHFDSTPDSTPYDGSIHLRKNKEQIVSQSEYAQIIGSLMHLMNYTRPNIAYVVGRLSRYTHCPNKDHWSSANVSKRNY